MSKLRNCFQSILIRFNNNRQQTDTKKTTKLTPNLTTHSFSIDILAGSTRSARLIIENIVTAQSPSGRVDALAGSISAGRRRCTQGTHHLVSRRFTNSTTGATMLDPNIVATFFPSGTVGTSASLVTVGAE